MPLILDDMARPAQITQNNRFADTLLISWQKLGRKLIFSANEHHSYLWISTIIFDGYGQACLKYSK